MRYLMMSMIVVGLGISVSACMRSDPPSTSREMIEQEERKREVLDESSPRNMNNLPKVTPEVVETFKTRPVVGN